MRLTTKSRHAITAMLHLARHGDQGPVKLSSISESQNVSLSYLEQLFAQLRSVSLVRGVRGPGGGYYLGRDSNEISVASIVSAVDGHAEQTASARHIASGTDQDAKLLWRDLSMQIFDFLAGITLGELVRRGQAHETTAAPEATPPVSAGFAHRAA